MHSAQLKSPNAEVQLGLLPIDLYNIGSLMKPTETAELKYQDGGHNTWINFYFKEIHEKWKRCLNALYSYTRKEQQDF